eukprot:scaffold10177_cov90-Skeletonema_dohrnii-CCMP3373.AAC.2
MTVDVELEQRLFCFGDKWRHDVYNWELSNSSTQKFDRCSARGSDSQSDSSDKSGKAPTSTGTARIISLL